MDLYRFCQIINILGERGDNLNLTLNKQQMRNKESTEIYPCSVTDISLNPITQQIFGQALIYQGGETIKSIAVSYNPDDGFWIKLENFHGT